MTSCDVIQDLLPLYADGQASEASRQLVEAHIRQCKVCADIASAMCTPIEQAIENEDGAYLKALKQQKRRNRIKIILACALTVLLCFVAWWLYMETHFIVETPALVSTSEEDILKEVPQLALTQAEKDFSEKIRLSSVIQDAFETDTIHIIEPESLKNELSGILPEQAALAEISSTNSTLFISYTVDNLSITIAYLDPNHDGTVDAINKTIGNGNFSGTGADTVYSLQYIPVLDIAEYEKNVLRHIWFGFLDKEIFTD